MKKAKRAAVSKAKAKRAAVSKAKASAKNLAQSEAERLFLQSRGIEEGKLTYWRSMWLHIKDFFRKFR